MTIPRHIRPPFVAGRFYPADPSALRDVVESMLSEATCGVSSGRVTAVISPHAGYRYSGPTAAHAFARVRDSRPGRVVLLGCSHHYRIEHASVFAGDAWESPLGELAVDRPLAKEFAVFAGNADDGPHYPEHSLEAQVPFVQVALGEVTIVPVLLGSPPNAWHQRFGEFMASCLTPEDLVVCSTDLSHFLTSEQARAIDLHSVEMVLNKDVDAYVADIESGHSAMCGAPAVCATMSAALSCGADEWRLLDYRNSGATSGDLTRVVGYGALSMEQVH